MNRNDLIALINDLLGGSERGAAERIASIMISRHGRIEDAAEAVRAMDDASFFALAAGGEDNFLRFEGSDDDVLAVYSVRF